MVTMTVKTVDKLLGKRLTPSVVAVFQGPLIITGVSAGKIWIDYLFR